MPTKDKQVPRVAPDAIRAVAETFEREVRRMDSLTQAAGVLRDAVTFAAWVEEADRRAAELKAELAVIESRRDGALADEDASKERARAIVAQAQEEAAAVVREAKDEAGRALKSAEGKIERMREKVDALEAREREIVARLSATQEEIKRSSADAVAALDATLSERRAELDDLTRRIEEAQNVINRMLGR